LAVVIEIVRITVVMPLDKDRDPTRGNELDVDAAGAERTGPGFGQPYIAA
jgi:hypothetical protein